MIKVFNAQQVEWTTGYESFLSVTLPESVKLSLSNTSWVSVTHPESVTSIHLEF